MDLTNRRRSTIKYTYFSEYEKERNIYRDSNVDLIAPSSLLSTIFVEVWRYFLIAKSGDTADLCVLANKASK